MSDLRPNSKGKPTAPIQAAEPSGRRADHLHIALGTKNLLDLRSSTRTISAATKAHNTAPKVAAASTPTATTPIAPAAVSANSAVVPQPAIKGIRTQPPASVPSQAAPPLAPSPQPDAASLARLQRISAAPKHPAVKKFSHPPDPVLPILPAHVASQVKRLGAMAASTAARPTHPPAGTLQAILEAARPKRQLSPAGIAAALAAIVIMGGIIYAQNAPKMAFRNAATKAGVEASLPTYLPSSYRQAGPIGVRPGEISINFSGTTSQDNLNVTQRRTDWDAGSLRENYIARQTDKFLTVEGQGLTIYIYNNNQAAWVNHGIWYSIVGNTKLNREQILKIAYGL